MRLASFVSYKASDDFDEMKPEYMLLRGNSNPLIVFQKTDSL
ncbi:MAG: hypothetical protein ACI8RD_000306 [Bacillariaceae sp.]|jgi:hypothetical protein